MKQHILSSRLSWLDYSRG